MTTKPATKKRMYSFRLRQCIKSRLDLMAARRGIATSELVGRILEQVVCTAYGPAAKFELPTGNEPEITRGNE